MINNISFSLSHSEHTKLASNWLQLNSKRKQRPRKDGNKDFKEIGNESMNEAWIKWMIMKASNYDKMDETEMIKRTESINQW